MVAMEARSSLVPVDCISAVNDHLLISGFKIVTSEALQQREVTCLINASNLPSIARYTSGVAYLAVRVDDHWLAPLHEYFDSAADLIEHHRLHGGKTLVHCVEGISRSACLCIVYLIKYGKMSLKDAYHAVYRARDRICPNPGFWRQMISYEKRIRGKESVMMLAGKKIALPDVYFVDGKLAGRAINRYKWFWNDSTDQMR